MFEDLKWLIELQKVDSAIFQITGEQRTISSKIEKLNNEVEELSLNKLKSVRKQKEYVEDKESYQEDILDHERILGQKKSDLDNEKKTKKEHIKREVKKLEIALEVFQNKVSELDEENILLDEEILEKDEAIGKIKKKIKSKNTKIRKITKINQDEIDKLNKKKKAIEGKIRKPFLNHYYRILKIRNGVAITFVTHDGLCDGCKIHIPYQFQQKIKLAADYNICEGCGRILVADNFLNK
ncbi:MAG: hypothetical protein PF638_00730 [Candidatus Delongbacteria bacterium]|jgi:predicted  nucleic acid-binding Zn-ribbon protein|nr:hypothetical protein [Candidatus Delongbacteria bacterium]